MLYQMGSIAFLIFGVLFLVIIFNAKNEFVKAFYLICFLLSNIISLLNKIIIKLQ